MKTIETKIAKNGATIWYVDGKRVSRKTASEIQASNDNSIMTELFAEQGGEYIIRVDLKTIDKKDVLDGIHWAKVNSEEKAIDGVQKILSVFGGRVLCVDAKKAGKLIVWANTNAKLHFNTPEANIEDYAVTVDAQDSAVDAEIEQATNTIAEVSEEPKTTTTIEVKTFESGRFSLKLNGKKVALKTFSFDNGFYSFPADTEIIFNGRKLRYIGTFREFFDTEYLFADENGNGVRNDKCDSLIWNLAKFGTHDVSRQIAQVANDKKAYFVRAKIESEQHAIDAEHTFCRAKIKMIDSNVFNLLPDCADEDDDDELIDEPEQAANTVAESEIDGYDAEAFNLLPIITYEEEELREYLYDFDEKQEVLADKYEVNAPTTVAAKISEEPEVTKAEKITTVIANAKDFIATNLDEHTEKVFKLCFGIHASFHFYLNNLKDKLVREMYPIEDELLAFNGTAKKFYDAYLAASDGYLDSEEMNALCSHIYDCTEQNYSDAVWKETLNIAEEILHKLGEETLMRELAKVTDEFGISRDLLNQSGHCDFKPFNLDTAPDTPDESTGKVAEHLNANAPEGWTVIRENEKLRVEYQGKFVADAERVTDRDLIVPQAFFRQFEPLIDKSKTPEQMFLDDRYRELADLEEMRKSPDCTPAAIETLDEMINRLKRDIAEAEFYERDTVAAACKAGIFDDEGNLTF